MFYIILHSLHVLLRIKWEATSDLLELVASDGNSRQEERDRLSISQPIRLTRLYCQSNMKLVGNI